MCSPYSPPHSEQGFGPIGSSSWVAHRTDRAVVFSAVQFLSALITLGVCIHSFSGWPGAGEFDSLGAFTKFHIDMSARRFHYRFGVRLKPVRQFTRLELQVFRFRSMSERYGDSAFHRVSDAHQYPLNVRTQPLTGANLRLAGLS